MNAPVGHGKRVFTGSVADGVWHAPGKDSFVAQWIEDAGGKYALETVDDQSNVALSLEAMLELVSKTDAWVLVTYDKDGVNERDVVAMDPRHAEVMKAVDEVWVCNTAEVDYFGEVVAHPEWVLEDLAALVQSNSEGAHGVFENSTTFPKAMKTRLVFLLMLLALGLHVALARLTLPGARCWRVVDRRR